MDTTAKSSAEPKNNTPLSFEQVLSEAEKYKKIKAADTGKSIYLVSKAMGDRMPRAFSKESGHITFVQLYRILNGTSIDFSNKTIACVISAADPDSGVTLDALMEAQGRIRKDRLFRYKEKQKNKIRQIVADSLLMNGFQVSLDIDRKYSNDNTASECSVLIRKLGRKQPFVWNFEIQIILQKSTHPDYTEKINKILSRIVTLSSEKSNYHRYSVIFDNEQAYFELKRKVENIRIPNEVSLVLVSTERRKVVEEFIVPRTKRTRRGILFTATAGDQNNKPTYSVDDEYRENIRVIIANDLLLKGYEVRKFDFRIDPPKANVLPLIPDFSFSVQKDGTEFTWSIFAKASPDIKDYSKLGKIVHDWFIQSLACFYTECCTGKTTFVVNSQEFYRRVIHELSVFRIADEISVILIDEKKRTVVSEKLLTSEQD